MQLVQELDRRGWLKFAAAAVASSAGSLARAQTFITDAGASGSGVARAQVMPEPVVTRPTASQGQGGQTLQAQDWKHRLLAGERSILMRRDGAVQRVRYCTSDGLLDREGYAVACNLLRDVRAGRLFTMDPSLLDVLCGIQRWGEFNGRGSVIRILSGFRTAATNSSLEGAALNSMHLYGRAADIVLEGFPSGLVAAMALQFNDKGGNGIYLGRGFVHTDTGVARHWVR